MKPENLLLQPGGGEGKPGVHLRLIDFGSAIDAHTVRQLYGTQGPSVNEQTQEYAPPEALLGRYLHGPPCIVSFLRFFVFVSQARTFSRFCLRHLSSCKYKIAVGFLGSNPADHLRIWCNGAFICHVLTGARERDSFAPCRYWTGEPVLKRTWPYDMWSLGVSWLELVLGTRHVFQASPCHLFKWSYLRLSKCYSCKR